MSLQALIQAADFLEQRPRTRAYSKTSVGTRKRVSSARRSWSPSKERKLNKVRSPPKLQRTKQSPTAKKDGSKQQSALPDVQPGAVSGSSKQVTHVPKRKSSASNKVDGKSSRLLELADAADHDEGTTAAGKRRTKRSRRNKDHIYFSPKESDAGPEVNASASDLDLAMSSMFHRKLRDRAEADSSQNTVERDVSGLLFESAGGGAGGAGGPYGEQLVTVEVQEVQHVEEVATTSPPGPATTSRGHRAATSAGRRRAAARSTADHTATYVARASEPGVAAAILGAESAFWDAENSPTANGGPATYHREVHNTLEKNRRANLKRLFEYLKTALNVYDEKISNLNLLRYTVQHVMELRGRESEMVKQKMESLARQDYLISRLRSLSTQLSATASGKCKEAFTSGVMLLSQGKLIASPSIAATATPTALAKPGPTKCASTGGGSNKYGLPDPHTVSPTLYKFIEANQAAAAASATASASCSSPAEGGESRGVGGVVSATAPLTGRQQQQQPTAIKLDSDGMKALLTGKADAGLVEINNVKYLAVPITTAGSGPAAAPATARTKKSPSKQMLNIVKQPIPTVTDAGITSKAPPICVIEAPATRSVKLIAAPKVISCSVKKNTNTKVVVVPRKLSKSKENLEESNEK